MSTQPRQCWSVLVQKTTRDKTAAQLAMTQAQAQLERLQANAQRIETMMSDYRTQHESVQGQAHQIADSLNYRRFIDQLETLRERVQRDVTAAATQRERLRQVLLGLEMELNKLAKLQEQDAQKALQQLNKREQNRLDEWGVMRYQFGKQAGCLRALGHDAFGHAVMQQVADLRALFQAQIGFSQQAGLDQQRVLGDALNALDR